MIDLIKLATGENTESSVMLTDDPSLHNDPTVAATLRVTCDAEGSVGVALTYEEARRIRDFLLRMSM